MSFIPRAHIHRKMPVALLIPLITPSAFYSWIETPKSRDQIHECHIFKGIYLLTYLWKWTSVVFLLVYSSWHIFNVFSFVLHSTVVMVSLHTGFYFTSDSSTGLTAQCTLLSQRRKDQKQHFKVNISILCLDIFQPSIPIYKENNNHFP